MSVTVVAILAFFSGLLGKVWRAFCDLLGTPVGAAMVAGVLCYFIGVYHEHTKLEAAVKANDTAWQVKWVEAEQQAELDRQKRDALVKAKMQADADARLADISDRKDQLEQMVQTYEQLEAKQPAPSAGDLTDSSDARWLRDAKRAAIAKSKARRGLTK